MPKEYKSCGDCPLNGTVLCYYKPTTCKIKKEWEKNKEKAKEESQIKVSRTRKKLDK